MNNEIIEIVDQNDFNELIKSSKPVLVDFYATWCGPCKMQAPILYEFKSEIGEKVTVAKVDVDQLPILAEKYGIFSIPTITVFKNGELKEKSVGLSTKANLAEMVIKHL